MNRKDMRAELQQRRADEKLKDAQKKVAELLAATIKAKSTEPHRNHSCIALGAEDYRLDLRACHAPARLALRSMPLPLYVEALDDLFSADESLSVAQLEAKYIIEHDAELKSEGERIVLLREIEAYEAECRSWEEKKGGLIASGKWRDAKVSVKQAWLVERTCQHLRLELRPKLAKRGDAHDWLADQGANLRLKTDGAGDRSEAAQDVPCDYGEAADLFGRDDPGGTSELASVPASNASSVTQEGDDA